MKILLISPPYRDFYFTRARIEPLGLLYIKKSLSLAGYDSVIIDFADVRHEKKEKLPEEFSYLRKYYHKDLSYFSLFSDYKRLGFSYDEMCALIKEHAPDIVFVSANFSAYASEAREVISAVRSSSGALIIAGGWSVTAEKDKIYDFLGADYLLQGDFPSDSSELMKCIIDDGDPEKIPGLIYKENDKIIINKPADYSIPDYFPERSGTYFFRGRKIAKIILSRGCRNRCAFCSVHRNGKFSFRSIESVDTELQYLFERGIEVVDIEDDSVFFDKVYASELLNSLKKYSDKGMKFAAMNGMSANDLIPFAEKCIDCGFIEFNLSLVSSDEEAIRASNRPFGLDSIKDVLSIIDGRVETIVYLIAGLKGGRAKAVFRDIRELAMLPVTIGISPLYTIPGISFFDEVAPDQRQFLKGSALYKFFNDSREDVASAMKCVRMVNRVRGMMDTEEDAENIHYYKLSAVRKRWYRKTRNGWIDSFEFDADISCIDVLKNDRTVTRL
ncbi:MAG: radical SAM protein [Spirochaetes bacterium]|nr:radical SAM protein [Spirochaetota bacterium]